MERRRWWRTLLWSPMVISLAVVVVVSRAAKIVRELGGRRFVRKESTHLVGQNLLLGRMRREVL